MLRNGGQGRHDPLAPRRPLGKATLLDNLTNGAVFVGRRLVIVDRRILLGETLILQTYCPTSSSPARTRSTS